MTGEERRGAVLTDHRLMAASGTRALRDAEERGARVYVATYATGEVHRFAVASAEHARVYAREYGARIIGAALVDCRWDR